MNCTARTIIQFCGFTGVFLMKRKNASNFKIGMHEFEFYVFLGKEKHDPNL